MKPSKRREIRNLARRASERAHPAPPPAPSSAPEVVIHEVVCLCGQFLRLNSLMNGKRCSCPACRRKFLVTFTDDGRVKGKSLVPVYLDDSLVTGQTIFAESVQESEDSGETKGEFDDLLEPPRPSEIRFVCPCGRNLLAKPASYDQRVKCPHCAQRMLLTVVYDPEDKVFKIQPVRVAGDPAGDTRPADEQ